MSALRPGFYVSTLNPEDVREVCSVIDYARLRAARYSRDGRRYVVWEWNARNGLRRTRAMAEGGRVRWYRPCRSCDERGCESCEFLGSIVDPAAAVERYGDGV